MTVTAAMLATVRRLVDEPTMTNYDDALLTTLVEQYPLLDERGEPPYTWDTATSPPTKTTNADWLATYDLHATAAQVWEDKAAKLVPEFGFSADGGKYDRQQKHDHAMQMVRHHNARRAPRTIRAYVWPKPRVTNEVVGNLPEE